MKPDAARAPTLDDTLTKVEGILAHVRGLGKDVPRHLRRLLHAAFTSAVMNLPVTLPVNQFSSCFGHEVITLVDNSVNFPW